MKPDLKQKFPDLNFFANLGIFVLGIRSSYIHNQYCYTDKSILGSMMSH